MISRGFRDFDVANWQHFQNSVHYVSGTSADCFSPPQIWLSRFNPPLAGERGETIISLKSAYLTC